MIGGLHWLGHDSFRLDGSKSVYIDPWKLPDDPAQADIVFVTHDHYDHFSPPDIARLVLPGSVVVGPRAVTSQLDLGSDVELRAVAPGDATIVAGVGVTAVPAYNTNKFREPGVLFHPPEAGYVGYLLDFDGRRIYHAGDTDVIPEMAAIDCDVALLPVGGTYTMTADEAAEACALLRAKVVVPMHYGDIVGDARDADRFTELCRWPARLLPLERW